MKNYYVYLAICSDNSYYIGITNNIEKREAEHNYGLDEKCYTFSRRPIKILFSEEFSSVNEAIAREKQLKGWSRKKKEALIKKDFKKISELSRFKASTSSA